MSIHTSVMCDECGKSLLVFNNQSILEVLECYGWEVGNGCHFCTPGCATMWNNHPVLRLAAAAPDLLEACKQLLDEPMCCVDLDLGAIDRAVAKAEGSKDD